MILERLNHPSLDDLRAMPVGEIAALPTDQLGLLQDEAEAVLRMHALKKLYGLVRQAGALGGERAALIVASDPPGHVRRVRSSR